MIRYTYFQAENTKCSWTQSNKAPILSSGRSLEEEEDFYKLFMVMIVSDRTRLTNAKRLMILHYQLMI